MAWIAPRLFEKIRFSILVFFAVFIAGNFTSSVYFPSSSYAQTYIFEISDTHAHAENLVTWMRAVHLYRAKILNTLPPEKRATATFIVLVNGDYAGASPYTLWASRKLATDGVEQGDGVPKNDASLVLEKGFFALQALVALANDGFVIVKSDGNHDGRDFSATVLLNQERWLAEALRKIPGNEGYGLLAANLEVTDRVRELGIYQDFQDVVAKDGTHLRFYGMVLTDYFNKIYGPYIEGGKEGQARTDNSGPPLYRRVVPILEKGREILDGLQGVKGQDRPDAVVFALHERVERATQEMEDLLRIPTELPIPVVFAGHDHKKRAFHIEEARVPGNGTWVLDAGSNFDMSIAGIATGGLLMKELGGHEGGVRLVSIEEQQEDLAVPSKLILENDRATTAFLARLLTEVQESKEWLMSAVLDSKGKSFLVPFVRETKGDLKTTGGERPILGDLIADAFARYGSSELKQLPKDAKNRRVQIPVLAFFNSSSMRSDDPIGTPGERTKLLNIHLARIDYLLNSAQMVFLTGSQVETLYTAIRNFRLQKDKAHSPQIPGKVKVRELSKLSISGFEVPQYGLEYRTGSRRGKRLVKDQVYLVVMDQFLFLNEMMIPEMTELWAQMVTHDPRKVMPRFYRGKGAWRPRLLEASDPQAASHFEIYHRELGKLLRDKYPGSDPECFGAFL